LTGRIALVRPDPRCATVMAMIQTIATKWGDARIWVAMVDRRYRGVPKPRPGLSWRVQRRAIRVRFSAGACGKPAQYRGAESSAETLESDQYLFRQ
jgi:hypothetical protein